MKFNDYIKEVRESSFLTQEEAALALGVSTTTVQKWEKDTLPDKSMWAQIIKVYGLEKSEFLEKYGDSVVPDENAGDETAGSDFPAFLFPDDKLPEIEGLVLSKDEQELLGLEVLYQSNSFRSNGTIDLLSLTPDENSIGLPYEYVKTKGAFRIMALHDNLLCKLGDYKSFVIDRIKEKPSALFNIKACSKEDIVKFTQYVNYGSGRQQKNLYDTLAYDIEQLRFISGMPEPVIVSRYNPRSRNVLGDKWENEKFYQSISRVSPAFVQIIEKESEEPGYLELKAQYEKDMEFYREHQNMIDHEPVKPAYNGYKVAIITETGKKFLEWGEDVYF